MSKQRKKLHVKLAIHAVQLALVLGFLISASQVYLDLSNERDHIGHFVDELLKSSKEAATEAAYELDQDYSKTIVNGLVKYESIANISIFDDRSKTLAFAGVPTQQIKSDWLANLIVGEQIIYSTPLTRGSSEEKIGSISVTINAKNMSDNFLTRAKFIFLSGFFRSMALMLTFLVLFYIVLSRPLIKTIGEISELKDKEITSAKSFGAHLIERKDELGELVEIFINLLERRKQAEAMTERTKQQYFHREKVAAIGQMAAGILHEIGNPIASMSGSTQHLQDVNNDKNMSPDEIRQENLYYLDIIEEQTARLTKLTKEIANYVSPQIYEPELIDLNATIEHSKALLRYDSRLKYSKVLYDVKQELPAVFAIQAHVVQIFLNLMVNAGYACQSIKDKKTKIIISTGLVTENDQDFVVLSIADNGPGMSEKVQEQAFEPFFTTKKAGSGTGLGLTLCHSLADEQGGHIEIVSQQGIGTEVSLLLPTLKDEL